MNKEVILKSKNKYNVFIKKKHFPEIGSFVESVISCSSESNYTILQLKNNKKITASRTLKEIEELLEDYSFARVHHSYLVNLNEVEKYVKGEGGYLLMSDGSTIDVPRSRKEILLKKLQPNKQ